MVDPAPNTESFERLSAVELARQALEGRDDLSRESLAELLALASAQRPNRRAQIQRLLQQAPWPSD